VKKYLCLFLGLMLIFGLFVPTTQTYAAMGGLLNGKEGYYTTWPGQSDSRATDNDLQTSADIYSGSILEWGSSPVTITSYKSFLTEGRARLIFYNGLRQFLYSEEIERTSTIQTVHLQVPVRNVVYIHIENIDPNLNTARLYEFDVFGSLTQPPINDLAAAPEDRKVTLSWSTPSVTEATYAYIKRSKIPDGPYVHIGTSTSNSYEDRTVTNGTTYYYVVTYIMEGRESDRSNEVSVVPKISPPQNLQAHGNDAEGTISLDWVSVTGATYYKVKRSVYEEGPYITVAKSVYETTYTDSKVDSNTPYYYVVTATNDLGQESGYSNEASAQVGGTASTGALLTIYLLGGQIKEYDLSEAELSAFLAWYDTKDAGAGPAKYKFTKAWNQGPFATRSEYVIFDKILTFDVDEYDK